MRGASSGGCCPSASRISTYSPVALRMPVFTAAPLPLLYGCRMTLAPAAPARSPVPSLEPSSITMTSRHRAADSSRETTSPMTGASFMAGITTETDPGSAKELLHDAVPCHLCGAYQPCVPESRRQRSIGCKRRDGFPDGLRIGGTDESVLAVDDKFQGAAGIAGRHHRLGAEEGFERDVAVVLVKGRVNHAERPGIQSDQLVARGRTDKLNAIGNASLGGRPLRRFTL